MIGSRGLKSSAIQTHVIYCSQKRTKYDFATRQSGRIPNIRSQQVPIHYSDILNFSQRRIFDRGRKAPPPLHGEGAAAVNFIWNYCLRRSTMQAMMPERAAAATVMPMTATSGDIFLSSGSGSSGSVSVGTSGPSSSSLLSSSSSEEDSLELSSSDDDELELLDGVTGAVGCELEGSTLPLHVGVDEEGLELLELELLELPPSL